MRAMLLLLLCCTSTLQAYESDTYHYRLTKVADASRLLDAHVNEGLRQVVENWSGGEDHTGLARAIYWKFGGIHWVDHVEAWSMDNPDIQHYPQSRYQSIYRGMPVWATRVNFLFGIGKTLNVAGVMMGSDKFGHFFSQGNKYFRRQHKGFDHSAIVAKGVFAERWIFGQLTTGVYSNADLVANYEGWLFYRSLFEEDVIAGKPAIISWRSGKPYLQREFAWADHVNDYWDEALNPSYVVNAIAVRLKPRIEALCPEYDEEPTRFRARSEDELLLRYEHAGLKPMPAHQFSVICQGVR